MSEPAPSVWQGRRFVVLFYLGIVAVAGVFGYVIGLARPEDLDPRLLGVIDMPPTPAGMALYGTITIGLLLGVLLLGVSYVAERYDTASLREE
jgi:hypothetical protein